MAIRKRMQIARGASRSKPRRRSPITPAPQAQGQWSLDDLKKVQNQARSLRAEGALSRIRGLAGDYRDRLSQRALGVASELSLEDVRLLLFRCNPAAHLLKVSEGLVRLKAPRLQRVPRLPEGYGFKGGVARLALRSLLGEKVSNLMPRDVDVVRFGAEGDRDVDVARQFMREDFAHGHGVELVPSIESYLASRDLTINEVVVCSGEVVCSLGALRDTVLGRICPTDHIVSQGRIPSRTAMKMIRLYAEAVCEGRSVTLEGIPAGLEVKTFDVTLHLERALSQSKQVAEVYLGEALRRGLVKSRSTAQRLLSDAEKALGKTS